MMLSSLEVKSLESAVRKHCRSLKDDAGFSGSWSDNGAGRLEEILDAWLCGQRGDIPKPLQKIWQNVVETSDPEWETYKRLKEKFENR